MAADDAIEVDAELGQVVVFDGESELGGREGVTGGAAGKLGNISR